MGASNPKNKESLEDVANDMLKTIESFIEFLQSQSDKFNCSPQIEALILFLSRIHAVIKQDYSDAFKEHGDKLMILETQAKGLFTFRTVLVNSAKEIQLIFTTAKDNSALDAISEKVKPITTHFPDISKRKLTLFLPKYLDSEGANYFEGYEPLVNRLRDIYKEFQEKFEKGGKSLIACQFWEINFPAEKELQFKEFEEKFKLMTVYMHKISLHDDQLEKLRKCFPQGKVLKKEFDEFIWNVWNLPYKRQEIVGK